MTRKQQIEQAASESCQHLPECKIYFEMGAEWADKNPNWISVEDELPPRMNEKSRFSETVLVYNKAGFKDVTYYDFVEKTWKWAPCVTHWMPIVKPKRGGNK